MDRQDVVCAISTYVSWLRILKIIYAFETGIYLIRKHIIFWLVIRIKQRSNKISNIPEIDDLCIYKYCKTSYSERAVSFVSKSEVEQIGSVYEYLMSLQIEEPKAPQSS